MYQPKSNENTCAIIRKNYNLQEKHCLREKKWSIKCKCVLFAYNFSWERGKNDAICAIETSNIGN